MFKRTCDRCDVDISHFTDDEYFACSICESCLKLRPNCKYCKEFVNEVNEEDETKKEFEHSHWMCIQDNRKNKLDLGWRKYADIDWDRFQKWMQDKYTDLFETITKLEYKKDEAHLVVITGINGGLCFNLQLGVSQDRIMLADHVEDWYDLNDKIIETFGSLDSELEIDDEESEKDYYSILEKIKELTLSEFLKYKDKNFNFDHNVKVQWELYES